MKRLLLTVIVLLVLIGSVSAYTVLVQEDLTPVELNNIAYYAYHDGDYAAAEAAYLAALALDPSYEKARYNLALLLFELERYEEAHPHFAQTLALAPGNAGYHFDYAANYVAWFRQLDRASAADFDHAIAEYDLVEQLSPGFPHAAENAAVLRAIKAEFFG